MGKKGSSSDSNAKTPGLSLTALLAFSPDSKNVDARCEDLLGEMYGAVFGTLSAASKSKIRNGHPSAVNYENVLKYLQQHPGIRDHILGVWKQWQPYPNRNSFSSRMISVLENTDFADAGTPEQVGDLKQWLRRRAEAGDDHDQVELLTTLTLLACTIGHWHDAVPLSRSNHIAAPLTGPLPQEADLLVQIRKAEDRQDLWEVIRLLDRMIEEKLCRSSSVGKYYYQLSQTWDKLREKTDDHQQRQDCLERAGQALNMACKYEYPNALLQVARNNVHDRRELVKCYHYFELAARASLNTQEGGEACWYLY